MEATLLLCPACQEGLTENENEKISDMERPNIPPQYAVNGRCLNAHNLMQKMVHDHQTTFLPLGRNKTKDVWMKSR